eukprot:339018_1
MSQQKWKRKNNENRKNEFVYYKKINMDPKVYINYNVIFNDNDHNVLRILSWNLCTVKHSAYATREWIKNNHKLKLVYLQIIKQKPDIIALQELPKHPITNELLKYFSTRQWFITRTFETDHMKTNEEPSDGQIMLINKRLMKYYNIKYNGNNNNIDNKNKWPGCILYDKYTNKVKLLLYSVHFKPGKQLFKERSAEFDELYAEAMRNRMNRKFCCIGDVNMRENEEKYIKRDYGMKSCWDIIPKHLKMDNWFTWHWNYYQPGNDYSLRYDRMFFPKYIQCKKVHIFDTVVSKYNKHFLSDHRGIVVTIKL